MAVDGLVAAYADAIKGLAETVKRLAEQATAPRGKPSVSGLSSIRFPIGTTVKAMERELILQTVAVTNGNKTRAAKLLGISLKTLYNKLKKYAKEGRCDG